MIAWLLDSSQFTTRAECGDGWTENLRLVSIFNNVTFATAYLLIPIALLYLYHKRRNDIPHGWMVVLFSAFIFFCGLSHIWNVVVFYWAPYRLFASSNFIGAMLSIAAACMLPRTVQYLIHLPTPEEYKRIADERQNALNLAAKREQQLREEYERQGRQKQRLKEELDETREALKRMEWRQEISADVQEIRQHLHNIRNFV